MSDIEYLEWIKLEMMSKLRLLKKGSEKDRATRMLKETERRIANAREAARER